MTTSIFPFPKIADASFMSPSIISILFCKPLYTTELKFKPRKKKVQVSKEEAKELAALEDKD